jgi:hypothetical protein
MLLKQCIEVLCEYDSACVMMYKNALYVVSNI